MKTNSTLGIEQSVFISAYRKALLYSDRKLSNFRNSGLVSKITPEDVANEAVAKTLSGKRPWNKEKCPDLFVHLAGCIRSEISNIYNSNDFKEVDRAIEGNEVIVSTKSNEPNAADIIEEESRITFIIEYVASFKEDLIQVAELVLRHQVNEPQDIAETLNITVKEVNTKKLALRRLMEHEKFLLYVIEKNRPDLTPLAELVLTKKAASDKEISVKLGIPLKKVKLLKDELERVVKDIYRGNI